jgi:hypothetical protein
LVFTVSASANSVGWHAHHWVGMPSMKDSVSSRRVQILLHRSLRHHPRRRRHRSICPCSSRASRRPDASASAHHPLSPRRREIPAASSSQPGTSSQADVACTLNHLSGLIPGRNVPFNEIRQTPPFTLSTVPAKRLAVMACLGVVFRSSRPLRPAQHTVIQLCLSSRSLNFTLDYGFAAATL